MWEKGCPLLLDALQVSRDTDSGEAFLQSRFLNISGQTIKAFSAAVSISLRDGTEEILHLNPLDADIGPTKTYTADPLKLSHGDVTKAQVDIQTVRFDSTEWSSHLPSSKLPSPPLLKLSQEALQERALELREEGCSDNMTASFHAIAVHDGWTLCPCGQVNVGTVHCVRCGLDLSQEAQREIDENKLLSAAATRKQRNQEKARERQEKASKRRKTTLKICVPVLLALLSALGFWFFSDYLPQDAAESKLSEFISSNQLYEYDEWVDYDEWESKSASYVDNLNELIGTSYPKLTNESKQNTLELLAKEQTIDAIYRKMKTSWAVDPRKLKVSLAIDEIDVQKDATMAGSFDVVVKSRENSRWDNLSNSFRCRYRATFTPDMDNGTIDMWPLQREATDLMY